MRVADEETGIVYRAATDEAGRYAVPDLPPGSYSLTAELPGFRKLVRRGIVLQVQQVARLDLTLEVGSVREVVEVTASVPLLNTETSSKGEVVTGAEISEMPLNGRDFNELAYLAVGVLPKAQGGQGAFANINGARADNVNFVVDGINNQNPRGATAQVRPPLESLQEFRVETSTYSAEYGRLAGGVLNMALRSGSNRFHGSLFEFIRNDVVDARSFFDPERLKLRRNQFGGSLGGPVILPRLLNGRQTTFFHAAWESYRQRNGQARIGRVPSLQEREGDFTQNYDARGRLLTVFDPLTRRAFPDNRVPRERFDPIALRLVRYYPAPTRAGVNNYAASAVDADDWDSFSVKIDRRIAGKHTLSFRNLLRDNRTGNPFNGSDLGIFGNRTDARHHMYSISYTHLFAPTMIQEVRMGLTRTRNYERSVQAGQDISAELGLPSPGDPRLYGFPRFVVRGLMTMGNANEQPVDFTVNNFQYATTVTKVLGARTLKFGADILRTQFFQPYFNNNRGTFTINGRWTADRNGVEGPADTNGNRSGAPFADFLLGLMTTTTRQLGWVDSYMFFTRYGFFAQHDWKLQPSLMLNLGLRYDLVKPPIEKYNKLTNFLPGLGRPVIAGEPGFPRALVQTDTNDWAPRVGFAWRPFSGDRTVVRGGYGIFYGAVLQNPIRNNFSAVYPFTVAQTFDANFNRVGSLAFADPFPDAIARVTGVNEPNSYQFDAPTSYMQQYNFTIERQLARSLALEVGYVGSKGTHLGRRFNLNQPYRRAEWAGNFPKPFPQYNTIDYFDFNANSNFNALAISLRNMARRRLVFRVNYMFSKSLDDASQMSDRSDGGFSGAQEARDLRLERGRSDFDRRHTLVVNYLYDLPVGRGMRFGSRLPSWALALFGNWQIGGLARVHSGQPFTPRLSNANLNLGEANRPDRLGPGTLAHPGPDAWYNLEDFEPVPSGAFRPGTSGRNILDGPGLLNLDVALYKRIAVAGERTLQLRLEAFNLPNRTNFLLPVETVDTVTAGTIRRANEGRLIQAALRFLF